MSGRSEPALHTKAQFADAAADRQRLATARDARFDQLAQAFETDMASLTRTFGRISRNWSAPKRPIMSNSRRLLHEQPADVGQRASPAARRAPGRTPAKWSMAIRASANGVP
jgi:hypothetical protein